MVRSAYLGVDVGTSSTKAVLVDDYGRILRSATRTHVVARPAPGHVEMEPDVWWREFCELAEELTGDLNACGASDTNVQAIGVSGMGPCAVLADADGHPVRPAILYGIDTRASDEIGELNAALGEDEILRVCGCPLSSQSIGPKLLWVRRHEPGVFARAATLFMAASWLVHRLTGAYVLDHHSASQSTPLYDRRCLGWNDAWCSAIVGHLRLPSLKWTDELAGETRMPLGGIPAGTPVVVGTIDAWAEAVSVDAHGVGDLMLMYGTTMFLIATVAEPLTSPSLWGTVGVHPGSYNLAGGTATAGAVTSWLRDLTGAEFGELFREAAASPPGSHGLLVLPYFAGERTPIFDADARGVLAGLTLSHTRGDLYRAVLEATAFAVRHNLEEMTRAGARIGRAVAVGGGTHDRLWAQIVSDVTRLPQLVPAQRIGASFGSAMLAAGLHQEVRPASWNPPVDRCDPDPSASAIYDEFYRLYRNLYNDSAAVSHSLAKSQQSGGISERPAETGPIASVTATTRCKGAL